MSRKIEVDIDTKTFIRFWLVILGFGVAIAFIWKAKAALIIIGISILLAIALRPLQKKVDKIIGKKQQNTLSAVLAYLVVLLVVAVIVAVIGPVVVNETSRFINQLPDTFQNTLGGWDGINNFGHSIGVDDLQTQISGALENFASGFVGNIGNLLVNGVGTVASGLASVILTLVLTLLFMLEGSHLMESFWKIIGGAKENAKIKRWKVLIGKMANVISVYFSKQVTIALLDGTATAVSVFILSLIFKFSAGLAFPMGLITMIFYLIPMFGQIIGGGLVTILLLFSSPIAAVIWLAFYVIYAQIEVNGLAPKIQGDAMNLPPIIILVAVTIGTYMFGLLGAIIAIPIAGCLKVLFEELPKFEALREDAGEK